MAQADGVVANGTGSAVRADINGQLAALFTNHSGSTEPSTTFAFQTWADTNTNTLKLRNSSNDGWVQLARLDGQFDAKTFNSNVTLNAQSDLRFADSDSSNWVAFQAPATVASNVTWTLPSADGTADQALTTNGSGVLSWADAGGVQDNITEGNTSAEVVDTGSDGHFKVVTEGTEALRVTPTQRLGVGTTSPNTRFVVSNSGAEGVEFDPGYTSGASSILAYNRSGSAYTQLKFEASQYALNIGGTEKVRLDSSGRFGIGTSSPTEPLTLGFADLGSARIGFRSATYTQVAMIEGSHDSGTAEGSLRFWTRSGGTETQRMKIASNGEQQHFGTLATNINIANTASAGTTYEFLYCQHSSTGLANGTNSFKVTTNGNVYNTNNSYGSLSDIKLKENIVDAGSQWDDLKAIQVRKYNFKAETNQQTHTQLGVIAQEVELVSPGLVTESPDRDAEGSDLGTVTKSVNYSVLYMKAVKALQEAMERIETLEAKVAALEAA